MIQANIRKKWIAQVTINMADDDELLRLAAKAGCTGILIGFESTSVEGLMEINKRFYTLPVRDFRAAVQRIQRHGILVGGSFIMGLDVDKHGIGQQIADTANHWNLDILNVHFLTPFPGTRLWKKMELEGHIIANSFPEDWKYYTLKFPVCRYKHLSWADMLSEYEICLRVFHSYPRILRRVFGHLLRRRKLVTSLVIAGTNFSYRSTIRSYRKKFQELNLRRGEAQVKKKNPRR